MRREIEVLLCALSQMLMGKRISSETWEKAYLRG
jgi:hypothetical protein